MAYLSGRRGSVAGGLRVRAARWLNAVALAAMFSLASAPVLHAEDVPLEQAIKATYLYKFAPFVTWPTSAAPKPGPFLICTSGTDEVTKLVPQVVAGQQVNGRSVDVRRIAEGDSPVGCQVLYIAGPPAPLLVAAQGKPILTVTNGASTDHGIIQFTPVGRHVGFDVDTGLAANAGLSISSKLLSLANAVTSTPQAKP